MMKMKISLAIAVIILSTGCANDYFDKPYSNATMPYSGSVNNAAVSRVAEEYRKNSPSVHSGARTYRAYSHTTVRGNSVRTTIRVY